jgi:hypothetical protein
MRHRLPAYALGGVLLVAGAGAVAQAEAERRLDAAIERLRAALPPEMRLEIGRRQVDPVTGRTILSEVVLTDGQGRLHMQELRLADVTETRLGSAEALRVTIRSPEGGTGEIARIMVAGVAVPVPGKSLSMENIRLDAVQIEAARMEDPAKGAVQVERLELRELRPDGVAAAALRNFEFRSAPQDTQFARVSSLDLEAVTLPLENGEFAPLKFRAGRIAIGSAEMRDREQNVVVALGRVALQGWMPGQATSLAIEGVQVAAPAGDYGSVEMSLAQLGMTGIDAARTLEAVMTGVQIPDPTPGMPQRVLLTGLDAAWQGQPVFALARLLAEGALESGTATGGVVAEGMRITPPRGQAAWLEMLGYSEILGGLEVRASAPRDGGRMEIAPIRLAWDQAATLAIQARLEGTPATPAPGAAIDADATAAEFAAARLAGMTIGLRDQGLLGRILAVQARQQRMPEARLREQWAQMAMAIPLPGAQTAPRQAAPAQPGPGAKGKGGAPAAPAASGSGDPVAPMRQALASFIRQPGTLEIAIRPPTPVPFSELSEMGGGNPVQTIQRLGITMTAR